MSYEALWLRAFLLTFAIEAPLYIALLRPRWRGGWPSLVLLTLALQLATHPALWFLAPRFSPYWAWVLVMELLVWLAEGALVAVALGLRPRPRDALGWGLLASLVANAVSTLVGLAIQ